MTRFRWFLAGAVALSVGYGCTFDESSVGVGGGSVSGGNFGAAIGSVGGTSGTGGADDLPVRVPLGAVNGDVLPGPSLGGAGGDDSVALGGQAGQGGQTGELGQAGQAGMPGGEAEPPPSPVLETGALVAGIWDDHLNYDWFTARNPVPQAERNDVLPVTEAELLAAHERAMNATRRHEQLDIALVLDTTGSMGDELDYLKAQLGYLWDQIELNYPNSRQRWALVGYRDEGDDYVTKPVDFSEDRAPFAAALTNLEAYGGGDLPEASDRALAALGDLSWRDEVTTARMAFWFTDAPHHASAAAGVAGAVLAAGSAGIKLYPVASDNAGPLATDTLRVAAVLTGGRYLFLLNRSDTGRDSQLPCFYAAELKHTMLRVIRSEMDGAYAPPTLDILLAAQGMPSQGVCATTPLQAIAY